VEVVRLALHQLREPRHAARVEIDDEELASLAGSIRELGLIQPLTVTPCDDGTFEVVAGHRRLLAARMVGLMEVPCVVERDAERLDAVKMHENLERAELKPLEEAQFYVELYERLGDVDKVAATVRRSRVHVENRMALLGGYDAVREALAAGKITLGVAEAFNKLISADDVPYFLESATRSGCNVRQARDWVAQANARRQLLATVPQAPQGNDGDAPPGRETPISGAGYTPYSKPWELSSSLERRPCLFCEREHEEWQMFRKFVCKPCGDELLVPGGLTKLGGRNGAS
jgi:ParB family chromosome partitioning protein